VTPLVIVLAVAAVVAFQLVRAHFFPWKRCPRCRGTKRIGGMGGFRICNHCDKDGKVLRLGAPRERD